MVGAIGISRIIFALRGANRRTIRSFIIDRITLRVYSILLHASGVTAMRLIRSENRCRSRKKRRVMQTRITKIDPVPFSMKPSERIRGVKEEFWLQMEGTEDARKEPPDARILALELGAEVRNSIPRDPLASPSRRRKTSRVYAFLY